MSLSNEAKIKLRLQLEQMEDYKQYPYHDTNGHLTVGIGRNLEAKGISRFEALVMLDNDIQDAEDELVKNISFYNDLDDVRKMVLINMCFNLGIVGLMKFKRMIDYLGKGNYAKASKEMLDSLWALQVKNRAFVLAEMMETGKY